jgi:hypothetical protein
MNEVIQFVRHYVNAGTRAVCALITFRLLTLVILISS